jgi:Holliday junction resolvase RusA-like endonuclease
MDVRLVTVSFTVPLVPPSVNEYKGLNRSRFGRGKFFVRPAAKAFKEALAIMARGGGQVHEKQCEVEIAIFLGHGDRGDIDNFAKVVLDALVAARVIKTDAAVTRLVMSKGRDWQRPRTEVTVRSMTTSTIVCATSGNVSAGNGLE